MERPTILRLAVKYQLHPLPVTLEQTGHVGMSVDTFRIHLCGSCVLMKDYNKVSLLMGPDQSLPMKKNKKQPGQPGQPGQPLRWKIRSSWSSSLFRLHLDLQIAPGLGVFGTCHCLFTSMGTVKETQKTNSWVRLIPNSSSPDAVRSQVALKMM